MTARMVPKPIDAKISAKLANMAFVCAVLVVLIHVSPRPQAGTGLLCKEFIWGFLSRIAVPFFFFASGYFLVGHYGESGWWMRSLRNRLRSIGVPFIIWSLLYWCLLYAYEVVMRGMDSPIAQSFCSLVSIVRIFGVYPGCPLLSSLWYCRNLILLVAISPLLCLALKRVRKGICFLFFVLLAYAILRPWTFPFKHMGGFFIYVFSLEGLFYFSLGIFFRLHKIPLAISRRAAIWCGFAALCLFALKLWALKLGSLIWLAFAWGSVPFLLLAVWQFMPEKRWPQLIVSSAFPIYLIHEFFIFMMGHAFSKLPCTALTYVLNGVCVLSLTLLVVVLFRKLLPRAANVAFGGR